MFYAFPGHPFQRLPQHHEALIDIAATVAMVIKPLLTPHQAAGILRIENLIMKESRQLPGPHGEVDCMEILTLMQVKCA